MAGLSVTWLGHASFRIDSPGGKRIYLDPWLKDNPKCPESEHEPDRCDIMALSHAHFDHVGSAVEIGKKFSPAVVAIFELAVWLGAQGVPGATDRAMNKGGTQDVDGIKFSMTHALHSSGLLEDGKVAYGGEAASYVIEFENGMKIYAAGDTSVFQEMEFIGRLYRPDVALLPIGDHFTMGPREAALALELLGVKRCVPCHYGTFPS